MQGISECAQSHISLVRYTCKISPKDSVSVQAQLKGAAANRMNCIQSRLKTFSGNEEEQYVALFLFCSIEVSSLVLLHAGAPDNQHLCV